MVLPINRWARAFAEAARFSETRGDIDEYLDRHPDLKKKVLAMEEAKMKKHQVEYNFSDAIRQVLAESRKALTPREVWEALLPNFPKGKAKDIEDTSTTLCRLAVAGHVLKTAKGLYKKAPK